MEKKVAAVLLLGLLALLGVFFWQMQQPLPAKDPNAFATSKACLSCHAQHHASWKQTYHRTMTQEAGKQSVQGRFDGEVIQAWGVNIRPYQQDGQFFFEYQDPRGQVLQTLKVDRTVGSHRYQQYLSKDKQGRYARLHLIWHNQNQRWVHYNGAFLYDDQQGFNEHAAVWNPNCIFCHNTGVQPRIQNHADLIQRLTQGEQFNYLNEAHWDSQVAELGIACESCHGPGKAHATANQNPLRRYWLHFTDTPDPSIINPKRLSKERSAQVCGQCHGQRQPVTSELVDVWLNTGPTYRAGDDLFQHVKLVQPTTEPAATFAPRFWQNGEPRLSAYEYQSLMKSKCYPSATCIDCHQGHGGALEKGKAAGMISAADKQGQACQGCHAKAAALPAHQKHAKASPMTNCVDCHMPKSVYGVMEIHRSHAISIPKPLQAAAQNRPDACTGCHVNQPAAWAAQWIGAWKGQTPSPSSTENTPENLRQLFAGDPVQRAIAAKLAGLPTAALSASERRAQIPWLVAALEDPYPAIRRFAQQSLQHSAPSEAQAAVQAFDFLARPEQRQPQLDRIRQVLPTPVPDPALLERLRQQANNAAINIGE
jgi:hypothetical protein